MKMTASQLNALHIENPRIIQYLIHEAGKHPSETIIPCYIFHIVQKEGKDE